MYNRFSCSPRISLRTTFSKVSISWEKLPLGGVNVDGGLRLVKLQEPRLGLSRKKDLSLSERKNRRSSVCKLKKSGLSVITYVRPLLKRDISAVDSRWSDKLKIGRLSSPVWAGLPVIGIPRFVWSVVLVAKLDV